MRLTIPLPLGWRLHIPAKDLIIASAITLSVFGIYFLRGALNQEFPHQHNIAILARAMTTAVAVPDVEGLDGGLEKSGSGGLEEFTMIGGERHRLPLTTERYEVAVRQVVSTKDVEDP